VSGRLDSTQRATLERLVSRCRKLVSADLSDTLEGRYGIRPDGRVEAAESMKALDHAGHSERVELVAVLSHFAAEGDPGRSGRQRLVREAAFTHLNRLLATRIAEAQGLIRQSLAAGRDSRGFRDLLRDVAPALGADDTGGYWTYLCLCGDELAADAPALFDPRNPLLALAPSPVALDRLVANLAPAYPGAAGESMWEAADTLGWAYQFFNDTDERSEMRKHAPETSRELAVRNQFFTPDYVVHYLVHNTLGRRLLDAEPVSPLVGELDWLIDPPTEAGAPLDLAAVKVLDPACGSGHFLLGAYDVLERAWHHHGVEAAEAATRILGALWGIEIDPRAAQVAVATLVLRARRACGPRATLPRPNVICARELPPLPEEVAKVLTPAQRRLVGELRDELRQAPVLGSLLKVEGVLGPELAHPTHVPRPGMKPFTLSGDAAPELRAAATELLGILGRASEHATSSAPERLSAAEAGDAERFVAAMSQRYDVVLMNPPFGEPVVGTKAYLKAVYPWIPTKDHNLLAAFVGRGIELCDENGYVGAITSRAGMFLTTFERWRTEVLLGHRLVSLVDLGFGVMDQALVEAAAYVISPGRRDPGRPVPFIRLLREPAATRGAALAEVITAARARARDERVFHVAPAELAAIPGSPLAYWMPASIRRLFAELPALEGHGAEVRQGLATGDDFRFVRAFWEVDPRRIAHDREATRAGRAWVPFAKGGEYSPYWADIHLLVDWEDDGARIRAYEGSVIRNQRYYFRPGITWPRRTQGGFNPSLLPGGCVFADKGPAIFPLPPERPLALLGLLLSRPYIAMLDTVATFGSYEVGAVARLPWPKGSPDILEEVVAEICSYKEALEQGDETTRRFVGPIVDSAALAEKIEADDVARLARGAQLLDQLADSEPYILAMLDLDEAAVGFLDDEVGRITFPRSTSDEEIEREMPRAKPPRWVDAELEGGAQRARVGVREAVTLLVEDSARRARIVRDAGERVLSYLLGCAFGRWDVRVGRDPSRVALPGDLLEPPAVCSPGMLVGADGFPSADAPAGYPLSIPRDGVLVDEAGHRADVLGAVEAAAAALVDEPSMLLHELGDLLGGDLRGHLRRGFFKDHLSRYSKSRRKAPIYWPLYVSSKAWGVWVYAQRISRETLFAVEAAADARLGSAIIEIRRLEDSQLSAGRGTPREVATMLESQRSLAEELRRFHREARRIAETGWVPDLDDGIVLCAAPLTELFCDWRPELSRRRTEIKAGMHAWADVDRYRDAL
jgi:hypothetical protein